LISKVVRVIARMPALPETSTAEAMFRSQAVRRS
jgi:hypothetical protein